MELDVGVPSSSESKILDGLDLCGVLTWIDVGSGVDLGPKRTTIGVKARLVGIDALATLLLAMIRDFAEHANLLVSIGFVSSLLLVRIPPRIRISPVGVAGSSSAVAPEVPVLTTGRLVGGLLWAKSDCINSIFCLVFDGKNLRGSFALLSGERFNGC